MARLVHDEGMYLDVATGGELHVAVTAGVPPDRLVVHGNNKSEVELLDAMKLGVHRIVVDSFDELDRLERLVEGTGTPPVRVLVRVTPGVEAHTHEYVMTGQVDRYAAQVAELLRMGDASDDYREGVAAFAAKRTPKFTGK